MSKPDSFLKSVSTLLSGTLLSMVVSLIAQVILARFFNEEAFGILATFQALVTTFSIVASLRFEDALALPRRMQGSANVYVLATLTSLLFSGLIAVLLSWDVVLRDWLRAETLMDFRALIVATIFLSAQIRILELWLTRTRAFRKISIGRVVLNIGTSSGQLAAGLFRLGAGGLMGGALLGRLMSVLSLGFSIVMPNRGLIRRAIDLRYLAVTLRRYYAFALYTMPAALLNTLPPQITILGLNYFFGKAAVGLYDRGYRYLVIPAGLLGNAVSQVFLAHAAEHVRQGHIAQTTSRMVVRLFALGIFPTIAVMISGPHLYRLLLGEGWYWAGEYARYLAPWLFLATIASPITILFDVLQKQRLDLIFSLLIFGVQATALGIAATSGDPLTTVMWVSFSGVALRLFHLGMMLRLVHAGVGLWLPQVAKLLLFCVPSALIQTWAQSTQNDWAIMAAFLFGFGIFGFFIFRFGKEMLTAEV